MASNTPRPTKAERRAAARAKAQALREEQERRERRLKITRRAMLGGGVVAAVGATAALVVASRRSAATVAESPLPNLPRGVGTDGSLTYGAAMTPGSVNEGAPVLNVYFDYACHFCANFEALHADEINRLVKDGKITLALHPCKILEQRWTDIVMNAMGLVLDRQPEAALNLHNAALALFSEIFASGAASRQTVDELASTAKKAGVSQEVVGAFSAAVENNAYAKWIETSTAAFADKGLRATPTVFLNGTQLNLQAVATATALTEAVENLPTATGAPAGGGAGAPAGGATGAPAEGDAGAPAGGATGAPAEGDAGGDAGAPATPSPESAG